MTDAPRNNLTPILLAVLAIVAFLPSLRNKYIWDDDLWLTDNTLVRDGEGFAKIWTDLNAVPEYYPLTLSSFWLEYHLWGYEPFGYHAINILLHAANTVLLWMLLRRLGVPAAALAAAIFAVHPVQVESVTWVTERKNVLSGLFYLLAMLFYFDPKESRQKYWLSILFFILAMLAKSVVVTLPAAILVISWWKQGKLTAKDFLRTLPFFAVLVPMTILSLWMQKHHTFAVGQAWNFTFVDRVLIAGRAWWHYVLSVLWPVNLMFIYPRWMIDQHERMQQLFPITALLIIIALFAIARLRRGPLAATLFFTGTLFPALGFLNIYWQQYSFVADHMLYLAAIGIFVLIAAAIERFTRATPRLAYAFVLAPLLILTWMQQPMYADSETLWRETIARNHSSWMAYTNLGHALMKKGDFPAAFEQYQNALRVDPTVPETHRNVGVGFARQGKFDDAIAAFTRAIQIDPSFVKALDDRGKCYLAQNKPDLAAVDFRAAVEKQPGFPEANFDLARALAKLGNLKEAIFYFQRTLEIQPDNIEVWINLANAQHQLGDDTAATISARRAMDLRERNSSTR